MNLMVGLFQETDILTSPQDDQIYHSILKSTLQLKDEIIYVMDEIELQLYQNILRF